jgi:chromosome segregation ATPase
MNTPTAEEQVLNTLRDIPGFVGAVAHNMVIQQRYSEAATYLLGTVDALALVSHELKHGKALLKRIQEARAQIKALRDAV